MSDCIFCKIAAGDIPSSKIYEDDDVIAFKDIHPQAPVHFLIVPKKHIVSLAETQSADEPLLGKMLGLVRKLAKEQGCDNGFRVIINTGRDGGQEVPHLHIHVLGGPRPWKNLFQEKKLGSLSVWHWLIVLAIVVLVFGTGKLKNMGKDLGGAIKGFKEGMREADDKPTDQTAAKEIPQQQTAEAKQADTIDVDAKEKPKA